mmetsp:Transcript_99530/g.138260  ORF Transcript_99530/g.138260 Transcript_99530/m.138260 type:complete len:268 (-) Transcript_99530:142-945(-)
MLKLQHVLTREEQAVRAQALQLFDGLVQDLGLVGHAQEASEASQGHIRLCNEVFHEKYLDFARLPVFLHRPARQALHLFPRKAAVLLEVSPQELRLVKRAKSLAAGYALLGHACLEDLPHLQLPHDEVARVREENRCLSESSSSVHGQQPGRQEGEEAAVTGSTQLLLARLHLQHALAEGTGPLDRPAWGRIRRQRIAGQREERLQDLDVWEEAWGDGQQRVVLRDAPLVRQGSHGLAMQESRKDHISDALVRDTVRLAVELLVCYI